MKTQHKPVDAWLLGKATLRVGSHFKVGSGRSVYRATRIEVYRGNATVVCYGPLAPGSRVLGDGVVFYLGPKPTTRVSGITGKRVRVRPVKVKLVKEPKT